METLDEKVEKAERAFESMSREKPDVWELTYEGADGEKYVLCLAPHQTEKSMVWAMVKFPNHQQLVKFSNEWIRTGGRPKRRAGSLTLRLGALKGIGFMRAVFMIALVAGESRQTGAESKEE